MIMKKQVVKSIIIGMKALGLTLLVSCAGQSSDPLKDYKDVKAVPKSNAVSPNQVLPVAPFVIRVKGSSQDTYVNMVEAKPSQFEIELSPAQLNTVQISGSTLDIIDFPYAANQPVITKKSAFNYLITWTPQNGTIADGELTTVVPFHIVTRPTDQGLTGLGSEKTIGIIVGKTNGIPKIIGVDGLRENTTEGDVLKFSIVIEDPNYNNIRLPIIAFPPVPYSNDEAFMASAHQFTVLDGTKTQNPEVLKNNRFRFHYIMDLTKLPVDFGRDRKINPNSAKVEVCLNILVLSSSGVVSNKKGEAVDLKTKTDDQKCTTAVYAAQPAMIAWTDKGDRKVVAGQDNTFKFTLSTLTGLSAIDILNANDQIKKLDGTKSIDCAPTDDSKTKLECTFKWNPKTVCGTRKPHPIESKEVEVVFKSTSVLNSIKKEETHKAKFEVTDLESNCAQAVATKEAAQAAELAKQQAAKAAEQSKLDTKEAVDEVKTKAQASQATPAVSQKSAPIAKKVASNTKSKAKPAATTAKPETKK